MKNPKADPDCEDCRGSGVREATVANGPNYTQDVPVECWCVALAEAEAHFAAKNAGAHT